MPRRVLINFTPPRNHVGPWRRQNEVAGMALPTRYLSISRSHPEAQRSVQAVATSRTGQAKEREMPWPPAPHPSTSVWIRQEVHSWYRWGKGRGKASRGPWSRVMECSVARSETQSLRTMGILGGTDGIAFEFETVWENSRCGSPVYISCYQCTYIRVYVCLRRDYEVSALSSI